MINAKKGDMLLEASRKIVEKRYYLNDDTSKFYVFHVPTNRILRRGIIGYENAKIVASRIRKQYGYKFNDVRFKIDKGGAGNIDNRPKTNQAERQKIYRYKTAKGYWKDWDE